MLTTPPSPSSVSADDADDAAAGPGDVAPLPPPEATTATAATTDVEVSLSDRTTRGLAWMMLQAISGKAITALGMIALGWIFENEEFGYVGLAYTVSMFANLIQQGGIREVLIQRHRHYRRWANAGFWMSLAAGAIASLFMVIAAPLAAKIYDAPEVIGLILVLALTPPIVALGVPSEADLQSRMQFRWIAVTHWVRFSGAMVLTVILAALGFGAYAYVLPHPITAIIRAIILLRLAPPPLRHRPQMNRWRYLFSDSGFALAGMVLLTFVGQGDFMLLGIAFDETTVGIYWFAYMLSLQSVMLLSNTLAQVLLPALSRLNAEPARQREAFLRAARVLAACGSIVCLLQAVCAGPAVRLVLPDEQHPIIPVIEILSIGMAIRVGWTASRNLILAQGRFRTYLGLVVLYTTVFLALAITAVVVADAEHASVTMSIAVAIFCCFVGPFDLWMSIRGVGGRWRDVGRVFLPGLLSAVLALIAPFVIDRWLLPSPDPHASGMDLAGPSGDVLRLVLYLVISLPLYLILIRGLDRPTWNEFRTRLLSLRSRR